jgi:hypothetical protein
MLHLAEEWKVIRNAPRIKLLEEKGCASIIEASTEALLLRYAPQPLADILVIGMNTGLRP